MECKELGCSKPVKARGWCSMHYGRFQRGVPLDGPVGAQKCQVEGCDKKNYAKGWCWQHQRQFDPRSRYSWTSSLTNSEFDKKLEEQSGLCAICFRPSSNQKRRLSVDHNHKCCPPRTAACDKCMRGLLCTHCNTRLWALEDEIWRTSAEAYLEKWKS